LKKSVREQGEQEERKQGSRMMTQRLDSIPICNHGMEFAREKERAMPSEREKMRHE